MGRFERQRIPTGAHALGAGPLDIVVGGLGYIGPLTRSPQVKVLEAQVSDAKKKGKRAEKILGAVNSGSVYWNCCNRVSLRLPWSGVGHSGVGVTLSTYGIETFTRPKAWHLKNSWLS